MAGPEWKRFEQFLDLSDNALSVHFDECLTHEEAGYDGEEGTDGVKMMRLRKMGKIMKVRKMRRITKLKQTKKVNE